MGERKEMVIQIDITDGDLKKLKAGKTLQLAACDIAGTPLLVVMKRLAVNNSNLIEDTDQARVLSLIPSNNDNPIREDKLIAEAQGRFHINEERVNEILNVFKKDGTIYTPRPDWIRRT